MTTCILPGSKTCPDCLEHKPLSEYGNCKRGPDGLQWKCKPCLRLYINTRNARRREAGLHRYDPESRRRWMYKSKYGITVDQYEQMLAAQDGACAICRQQQTDPRKKRLAVDHCHETGTVRGLLCEKCNRGIGLLGDNLASLRAATIYLEEACNKPGTPAKLAG